jgi:single-stranded-DNA-specific exonuclease
MLKQSSTNIKELAKAAGVSELIAVLLSNRDIKTPEEIKSFLRASLEDLHDGNIMKDMTKGASIIKGSIESNKKIVVYGDYDADGVVSTYILYSALKECGAEVSYYIPDRESEGYGMNSQRIRILKEEGCDVIITCDNGIAAEEQIKLAKELGLTVIVTDHHDVPFLEDEDGEKKFVLPEADAIINPKQSDCPYPFKYLCGGGIAFKFSEVLYELMGKEKEDCIEFIEYAAIATICDVVDLVGENRIIAKNGLRMFNETKNLGLKALMKETSLEGKSITAYHIGFVIGPCINATGRLESARLSVELLLSKSADEATKLAKKLHSLNAERQELTTQSVESIIQIIEREGMSKDKVLVVYGKEIHESIAGIVAGRIKERYNVPTIVITAGKEVPKGSGRSIEGYNMFEELMKCKGLLHKFGGHPMAAGLSIKEENIPALRKCLLANCTLTDEDIVPKLRIDRQMKLNEISFSVVGDIEKLEPYGKGNPSPVFAEKSVEVFRSLFIGKDKNILKLVCKIRGGFSKIDAISFDGSEDFKSLIAEYYGEEKLQSILSGNDANVILDMVFYPSLNEYNGSINIQMMIKDMRLSC